MHEEIIISGFGGQGVLFAGQLLAYAGVEEGRHVTWIPSYGPEMRGGTAHCTVIVSDEEIGSPLVRRPTAAIVLNAPSMERYAPLVKPGGVLVADTALAARCTARKDIREINLPAKDIANDVVETINSIPPYNSGYRLQTSIPMKDVSEQIAGNLLYVKHVVLEPDSTLLIFRNRRVPTLTVTPTRTPTNTVTRTPTPTRTATPTPPSCGPGSNYVITQSTGASLVPGTTDIGNHCDDCVTGIALPFPVQLYGQSFNSANADSNGTLQFSSASSSFSNACLPTSIFNNAIFVHWDDLLTYSDRSCAGGCGIYTSVSGTAPNRIFNIEWRAVYFNNEAEQVNFEVRLYEGQESLELIYARVDQAGSEATVGVQRGTGAGFTQLSCDTASLSNDLKLTLTQPPCSTLVGHINWQGAPAQPNARQQQPITLTLKSGTTEVNYSSQTTDASGFFTVSLDSLPNGAYDWRVKGPKFLANSGTVECGMRNAECGMHSASSSYSAFRIPHSAFVEMGLMRAGDANDTNVVNTLDFNIVKNAFGKTGCPAPDPGWDARADFNNDCLVNSTDFALLRGNFGHGGAPPIQPGGGLKANSRAW